MFSTNSPDSSPSSLRSQLASKTIKDGGIIKVVTLGDRSAGKTALIIRFIENNFRVATPPTIGASFLSKSSLLPPSCSIHVKFQVWDTSGDDRFSSMAPLYFGSADVVLVVYDVTDRNSFNRVDEWVKMINSSDSSSSKQVVIVATKVDLSSDREVTQKEGNEYAFKMGYSHYETSARTGENINEMFDDIANEEVHRKAMVRQNSNLSEATKLTTGSRSTVWGNSDATIKKNLSQGEEDSSIFSCNAGEIVASNCIVM